MTMLTKGTWVLVADGEKAMFLENQTDGQDPFLKVIRLKEQDNPRDRDQTSDRAGRRPGGGEGQRSAMQEPSWHELAKERFADELAEILFRQAHRGAFDQIVLVAPPKTLGALRASLHKEVAGRVVAELSKDVTNHPVDQIEALLKAEFA